MTTRVAWIITREGTNHSRDVVGILSSRFRRQLVQMYIEQLYALLNFNAEEHLDFARHSKPFTPYKTAYATGYARMAYGHNPWLVAAYCRKLRLDQTGPVPILHWQPPDLITVDPITFQGTGEKREMTSAPVHLPMSTYVNKFRPRDPRED